MTAVRPDRTARGARRAGQEARQGGARRHQARPVKDALSGSWLGHALHPLLTDVTIGSFTSAVALDWLGGDESEPAARRLIGLGLLSTLPTVASGYSDWADTELANDAVRRDRHRPRRRATSPPPRCSPPAGSPAAAATTAAARALALAAAACWPAPPTSAGTSRSPRASASTTRRSRTAPEDWTAVLDDAELAEGQMRCVEADGTAVMVARAGGEPVRALEPLLAPRRPAARGRARRPDGQLPVARQRVRPARRRAGPRPRRLSRSPPGTRASATGASKSAAGSLMRRARASAPAAASWTADRRRRGGARHRAHRSFELRLMTELSDVVHLLVLAVPAGVILALGLQAPNEDGRPPAYQSVLLVTGLLLLLPGAAAPRRRARRRASRRLPGRRAHLDAGGGRRRRAVRGRPRATRRSACCSPRSPASARCWRGWEWIFAPGTFTASRWLLALSAGGARAWRRSRCATARRGRRSC